MMHVTVSLSLFLFPWLDVLCVLRFHVAFSSTISAGGGGARCENATHGVVFAPWAGVFADGSSHQPPQLVKFCRHLCQHHVLSVATAAIVSAVCQANDHGFGGIRVSKQKRNTGTKEMEVKEYQEKEKIGSKPDKNGKRANTLGNDNGTTDEMDPFAHFAMYKVCDENGCSESDIVAAIDAAVGDEVDVLSLSHGSESMPLYNDGIAIRAFSPT
nr:subtilisin-like protease SBT1.7 [Tanacetum cinerariifolium]